MILFLLCLLLTIAVGVLAVRGLTDGATLGAGVIGSLGAGLGIGIGSSTYFALLSIVPTHAVAIWWVTEVLACIVLVVVNGRSGFKPAQALPQPQPQPQPQPEEEPKSPALSQSQPQPQPESGRETGSPSSISPQVIRWLTFALYALLLIGSCSFWAQSWLHPHADWDAIMIWNLRARYLERLPFDLHNAFSPMINWSHPDYPLLIPGISGLGLALTGENPFAPNTVAFIFSLLGPLLLLNSLALLKSRLHGLLAALILLTTPFWLGCGAMMYADVPIAYYMLCIVVSCVLYDREQRSGFLVLAGAFASMAAWTKNEGLMLIPCVIIASFIAQRSLRFRARSVASLLCGALPVLLVLIWFKLTLAPPNDLIAGQSSHLTLARLLNPLRLAIVLGHFAVKAVTFGDWVVSPIPFFVLFWFLSRSHLDTVGARRAMYTVVLMIMGFAVIFLSTPNDLPQQLNTAGSRLFLQLWPTFIFAIASCVSIVPSMVSRPRVTQP